MSFFRWRKCIAVMLAAMMLFTSVVSIVSADPLPQGATYFQGEDNVGQKGHGSADNDLRVDITADLLKHPIEFNINVPESGPPISSAALLIRARDVDEEQGEWDRVYFGEAQTVGDPIVREIGNLTGNNDTWNTTAFYLDPAMVKKGDNYVELQVHKRYGSTNNWLVKVDWGQLVINGGPKNLAKIDENVVITGTGTSRKVDVGVIPTTDGVNKTYIAEINLLDSQGNNMGTISKLVTPTQAGIATNVSVDFNDAYYGEPWNDNGNPILAGEIYTANVILFEQALDEEGDPIVDEKGKPVPAAAQDIWASNKPPIVRDIAKRAAKGSDIALTPADFASQYLDLDDTPDDGVVDYPLLNVKLTSLPPVSTGEFYLNGIKKLPNNNGTSSNLSDDFIELTSGELNGLSFRPNSNWSGNEVTFEWNGYDGTIYALAPAKVKLLVNRPPTLNNLSKTVNQGADITEFNVTDSVYSDLDGDPITLIKLTSLPEYGELLDGSGTPVVLTGGYKELTPEEFKALTFKPEDDQWSGTTSFDWQGFDGFNYSSAAKVNLTVKDVIRPSITDVRLEEGKPNEIQMTFDEPVKLTNGTGFTIMVAGQTVTVNAATQPTPNGNIVILTLAEPVKHGDEVKLSYNDVSGTVTDLGKPTNNKANPVIDLPVTNSVLDHEPPQIKNAQIDDLAPNQLKVTFDEWIKLTPGPGDRGFSVTLNTYGQAATVTGVTYSGDSAILTLAEPVMPGDVVKVWYDPGKGDLKDLVDNPAEPITDYPVANGVLDHVPPKLQDAVVEDAKPQEVKLTFNEPIQITNGAGITVTVSGIPATVTGVTYNGDKVILTLAVPVKPGEQVQFTYKPEEGNLLDRASNDAESSNNAPVTNLVRHPLDGWVGSRAAENAMDVIVAPGDPLKLSATTSVLADKVTAVLFKGQGALEKQVELTLVDTKPGYKVWEYVTYRLPDQLVTGEYKAEFASYQGITPLPAEEVNRLANNLFNVIAEVNLKGTVMEESNDSPIAGAKVTLYDPTGRSVLTKPGTDGKPEPLTAVTDADGKYSFDNIATKDVLIVVEKQGHGTKKRVIRTLPTELGQKDIVENIKLSPFTMNLTANPTSIVGDGVSTSLLTTEVRDQQGQPVADTEVIFSAPLGTFENGYVEGGMNKVKGRTDSQGRVTVQYKSEKIEGIISQNIPVTSRVDDESKGLHGEEQIIIAFQPAKISGVVTNTKDGMVVPVEGAVVKISKDFDGDGIVDFAAEAITNWDGSYSIAVPRGGMGVVYDIEITKPIETEDGTEYITYKQKAPVLQEVIGVGQEYESSNTITSIIGLQSPDNNLQLFKNPELLGNMKVYLKAKGGGYILGSDGMPKAFSLDSSGVFNADNVASNTEYEMEIKYVVSEPGKPDKEVLMNRNEDGSLPTVKVSANGEINISEELVDPYGTIRDSVTKALIKDAKVVLYYANTQRNIDNGRTQDTGVVLPGLVGFAPNDNASPEQYSDEHGFYAYMVFPETDYYLVVTKAGYHTYTSPTISVEFDIVKHDLELIPISGGSIYIPVKPDVSLNLTIDQNLVEEGKQSTITVDYKNGSSSLLASSEVKVTLPAGVEIIDAKGGKVDGNTITWPVKDLAAGQTGSFKIVVKWPQLDAKDKSLEVKGEFAVIDNSISPVTEKSDLKVQIFSKRFENLQHQRYILGYPDGQFKPDQSLTRAELAAIIARLTENNEVKEPLNYTDVQEDHWASNYIKIVTKYGYFNGFDDGTFRPEASVTRAELASVMARFLKLEIVKAGELHFIDVEGHWAVSAIEQLYRSKYVSGYSDGSFKPQNNIIRTEAVTLINRMLHRGPLKGLAPLFPDVSESHWAYGDVQEATVSHEATRDSDGSEMWLKNIEDKVK